MPLDQHIEGRHGERESCLEIRPDPVHDLFAMADHGQHRQHRLNEYAIIPLPIWLKKPSHIIDALDIGVGRLLPPVGCVLARVALFSVGGKSRYSGAARAAWARSDRRRGPIVGPLACHTRCWPSPRPAHPFATSPLCRGCSTLRPCCGMRPTLDTWPGLAHNSTSSGKSGRQGEEEMRAPRARHARRGRERVCD